MNDVQQKIERSITTTYRTRIWKKFVSAVNEYDLINEGDKIAVCISGGKDSFLLAKCMQELTRHKVKNFELKFLVMDPGFIGNNRERLIENANILGIPVEIFDSNIFDVVSKAGGSPCYLCAKMRRGFLYARAQEMGCNKIALGHHFNDVIETILMGIFYNGQYQTMPPKLKSKNFEGIELIRPMYKVPEAEIKNWANFNELNFINCGCPLIENCEITDESESGSKRKEMKNLIKKLKETNKDVDVSIFKSSYNICLDTVVGYKKKGKNISFLDEY